ncbi:MULTISPECIES: PEPxxWA-CTERM sorting domain-containing protein [Sphingomonas]|nr:MULTISPECIES: PEPxxWA-CTERM sorting domain-containing protein [Sphingomonas]MBA2918122.1 PEPxxWA-CTERM sorting domain-containing protein [Sphingomonas sp. CGMCC 1.13658]
MFQHLHRASALTFALTLAAPAGAAVKYNVTELKPLPGFARGAVGDESYGINDSGQSVGRMRNADSLNGARAVVWDRNGNVTQLATPGGAWMSKADGINNSGVISGDIGVGEAGNFDTRRAVRWTSPGNYQFLLPDVGRFSTGDVINDNGWIGGIEYLGAYDDMSWRAYVWSPDGTIRWVDPNLSNGRIEWFGANSSNVFSGTQAVIGDDEGTSFAAVVWSEGTGPVALPTRAGMIATSGGDINDGGIVIGADWDGNITDTGLWWDAAHNLHTLGFVPGTTGSGPNAINNVNQVVGWSADENVCDPFGDFSCRRAAIWDLSGGATDLNDLIDPGLGYTLLFANGINDLGEIYGEAADATGRRFMFLARPVPEPATWAMMVLGFACLGTATRHRRRAAAA